MYSIRSGGDSMGLFKNLKRHKQDKKYNEETAKVAEKHDDDGDTQKVRIRLFDSYGNMKKLNVRVRNQDRFLEKTRDKIARLFGAGAK
jgi:hypothetical protein